MTFLRRLRPSALLALLASVSVAGAAPPPTSRGPAKPAPSGGNASTPAVEAVSEDGDDELDEPAPPPERTRPRKSFDVDESTIGLMFTTNVPGSVLYERGRVQVGSFGGLTFSDGGLGSVVGVGASADYNPVCTLPCSVNVRRGSHAFALEVEGSLPMEGDRPLVLNTGAGVHAEYISQRSLRVWGASVALAGAVLPLAVLPFAKRTVEDCRDVLDYTVDARGNVSPAGYVRVCKSFKEPDERVVIPVTVVASAAIITGLFMAFLPDKVQFRVKPLERLTRGREGADLTAQGLVLEGSF